MEAKIKLFKKAIAGEVIASNFYSLASEITKNDEARMVFLELSGMEDGHAQTLVDHVKKTPEAEIFDAQAYLDDLIKKDDALSLDNTEVVRNGSLKEVLELAISLEHSAKDNYDQLADETIDPELKQFCINLSTEESNHARQLTNVLNSIDMDMEDRPGL
ncbi:MAG: ferritin family protein [Magnetococcales bacterium]|nr:ferritin family protein [Magnetococcales bacterium]